MTVEDSSTRRRSGARTRGTSGGIGGGPGRVGTWGVRAGGGGAALGFVSAGAICSEVGKVTVITTALTDTLLRGFGGVH